MRRRRGRRACACGRAARRRARARSGVRRGRRRRPRRSASRKAGREAVDGRRGRARRRPPRTGWRAGCRRSTRSCRAPAATSSARTPSGWRASSQATRSTARAVLSPACCRPRLGVPPRAASLAPVLSMPRTRRRLQQSTTRALHQRCTGGPARSARRRGAAAATCELARLRRGSRNSSARQQPLPRRRSSAPRRRLDPRPERLGVVGGHDGLAQPAVEPLALAHDAGRVGARAAAARRVGLGRLAHGARRAAAPRAGGRPSRRRTSACSARCRSTARAACAAARPRRARCSGCRRRRGGRRTARSALMPSGDAHSRATISPSRGRSSMRRSVDLERGAPAAEERPARAPAGRRGRSALARARTT